MSEPGDFPDIVEGIFPSGELHLISGSRGAGKTGWEVGMERAVMAGEPFMGRQTWRPPVWNVLIFDRSAKDRLAWWKAAGMEPLPYYCLTDDPTITPKTLLDQTPAQSLDMLSRCVDKLDPPPGSALTIDVANFIAGDANLSYRSGFAHGWALSKIAAERQITPFALMHGGKQKQGQQYMRLTDRTIASTGFMGTANACGYIATREETAAIGAEDGSLSDFGTRSDLQIFEWEPRKGPTERFVLGRADSGLFICLSGATLISRKPLDPIVQERQAQIIALLNSGELDGAEIRLRLNIPKATLSRDMNDLADSKSVIAIRSGKSMHYRLAETQGGVGIVES